MADRDTPIIPILLAAASGGLGITGALAETLWLGWLGLAGFVTIVLWPILTTPKQDDGRGNSSTWLWLNSGAEGSDNSGLDGGGFGGGGDGGGG